MFRDSHHRRLLRTDTFGSNTWSLFYILIVSSLRGGREHGKHQELEIVTGTPERSEFK